MKLIHDPSLLEQYLSGPPYTDYFEDGFRPYTQVMDYAAGESVLQQGVPSRYLFLMLRGRCCVRVALANGKTMILQTLKAPCLIGEMELLQEVSAFTVQALEKSRMLALPLIPCGAVLSRNVHFLRRICSDLILKERRGAISAINSFGFPLENRLAKFILDNRQGDRFTVKKSLAAESLGASYRHVETVMSGLVRAGCLSKEKLVYTITDEARLAALARELEKAE